MFKLSEIYAFLCFSFFHLAGAEETTYTIIETKQVWKLISKNNWCRSPETDHRPGLDWAWTWTCKIICVNFQQVNESNECWRFTWVGEADESTDTSVDCNSYYPDDLCFMPIVFTNGSSASGPDFG